MPSLARLSEPTVRAKLIQGFVSSSPGLSGYYCPLERLVTGVHTTTSPEFPSTPSVVLFTGDLEWLVGGWLADRQLARDVIPAAGSQLHQGIPHPGHGRLKRPRAVSVYYPDLRSNVTG